MNRLSVQTVLEILNILKFPSEEDREYMAAMAVKAYNSELIFSASEYNFFVAVDERFLNY